jgi:hypothetical protein
MSDHPGQQVSQARFEMLERIARRGQVWARVSEKHGVTNPVPPWKSSLDGMCDAVDAEALPPEDRRHEEDLLTQARYSALPFPESQLVALAHSLLARGVIDERSLARRMQAVRTRLEAA